MHLILAHEMLLRQTTTFFSHLSHYQKSYMTLYETIYETAYM
jgi:hypothetical protein